MILNRRHALMIAFVSSICLWGQSSETFRTRLSPVAIDTAMVASITGSGTVTAELAGSKLMLAGSFQGLKSPATEASIHQGSLPGVRGNSLFNLTVSKASSGTVSGAFDLNPEQVESLKKGRWYVQVQSENAPNGNLWGWLWKR